ncbi:MAG: hypothetical protein LBC54_01455 [Bacteroidales bacterium OttesenSCG-928-I14]|jgi:4-hydroxythreonine-4-phosphate dehydrogenase|nr:hypothetical protein [Bacteroidales bacterium OttesenSCG-928-I14]
MKKKILKIGISCGSHVNGVNLKQIFLTFINNQLFESCIPILYNYLTIPSFRRKNDKMCNVRTTNICCAGESVKGSFNIMNISNKIDVVGQQIVKSNLTIDKFLYKGLSDLKAKEIDILIILPIPLLQQVKLELSNDRNSLPILVNDSFRIVKIFEPFSVKNIIEKIEILHLVLVNDFIITFPRIAILSAKPSTELITDAIQIAFQKGFFCFGVFDVKTFFGSYGHKKFDAAIIVDVASTNNESNIIYIGNSPFIVTIVNSNMLLSAIYLTIDLYKYRKL